MSGSLQNLWRCAGVALLLCVGMLSTFLVAQEEAATEMPSFRRVWQDSAAGLPEAGPTPWVRLGRKEFEKTVAAAQKKIAAAQHPPWLTATRYEAELQGEQLVGTANWNIHNPHPFGAMLSLPAFNLAIRERPHWRDLGPALLGSYNSGPCQLFVEKQGTHQLTFPWSSRVEPRPDGLRCRLQLPSTAVSVLELTLPAAYRPDWPASRNSITLLGPDPKRPDTRRWEINCGGLASQDMTLVLRPETTEGTPTLVDVWQRSEYQVDLTGVQARFTMDCEAGSGHLKDLRCAVDPSLHVQEVLLLQAEPRSLSWRWDEKVSPKQLVITLPEGAERRATIEVRTTVQLPALPHAAPGAFPLRQLSCPALAPVGTAPPKETLRFRVALPLELTHWDFGDFQPLVAPRTEKSGNDTFEILILEPTAGVPQRRPTARITPWEAEATVRQESWWHVSAEKMQLTVRGVWQVQEGRLHTLRAQVPAGWTVEDVSLSPTGALLGWSCPTSPTSQELHVELRTPLPAGSSATLLLRLKPLSPLLAADQSMELPIPHVGPVNARLVEGNLAITLQRGRTKEGPVPLFSAAVRHLAARPARPPRGSDTLWSAQAAAPDFYYQTHQPRPGGVLSVEPLPPQAEAQVTIDLAQEGSRRVATYDLQVYPALGAVTQLPVQFSAATPALQWRSLARGTAVEWRPAALGGELHFTPPLREPVVLRAAVPLAPGAEIPLLWPDTAAWTGRLLLRLAPGDASTLQGEGLEKSPLAAPLPTPLFLGTIYRYDRATRRVRLQSPQAKQATATPLIRHANLTLTVLAEGGVEGRYEAEFAQAGHAPLRLRLPAGAILQEAIADGHPIPNVSFTESVLAVGAGSVRERLRIGFFVPSETSWWGGRLRIATPAWQDGVQVQATECLWNLPVEVLPLAGRRHDRTATGWAWRIPESDPATAQVAWLRQGLLWLVSLVLGIGCLGWMARRKTFSLQTPLMVGIALLLVSWLLPVGMKVLSIGPVIGVGLGFAFQQRRRLLPAPRMGAATAGILLAVLLVQAEARQPRQEPAVVVYILPGPPDQPAEQVALVPARLWQQLQRLEQQPGAGLPPYLLLQASYQAAITPTVAQWQGEIAVHLFPEESVEVPLHLGTTRLRQLTVDGTPALALPQGDSVRLKVAKAGTHTLRVAWDTPLREQGPEREVRCRTPRVPVSRMSAAVPLPARGLRMEGMTGGQRQERDTNTVQVQADLGDSTAWNLRWHADQEENTALSVEEVYFWDIRPQGVSQRAWFRYSVQRGAVEELRIVLPPQGELRDVELLPIPGMDSPPRVLRWRVLPVEGVGRVLVLTLNDLVRGTFRVHLELMQPVPRKPGAEITLPLSPAQPLNVQERRSGWGAFTTNGFQVAWAGDSILGLTETDVEQWARLLPATAGPRPQPQRLFHWSTWPPAKDVALTLQPTPPVVRATQHVTLGVALGEVRVQATAELQFDRQAQALLRWDLPPKLNVTDVTGSSLLDWSQEGSQLQLWLRAGGDSTTVRLTGWMPTEFRPEGETLRIPLLRFVNAKHMPGRLTLERRGSVSARWLEAPAGLQALPTLLPVRPPWGAYQTPAPDLSGVLLVEPQPPLTQLRASVTLTPGQEGVAWEARLQTTEERGPHRLRIIVNDWPNVGLRTPGRENVATQVRQLAAGRWEWTLQGTEPLLPLTINARLPWQPGNTVTLPVMEVPDAQQVQRRLRLPPELQWADTATAPEPDVDGWIDVQAVPGRKVKRKE